MPSQGKGAWWIALAVVVAVGLSGLVVMYPQLGAKLRARARIQLRPTPFDALASVPCAEIISPKLEGQASDLIGTPPPLECAKAFESAGKDGAAVYRVIGDDHDTWVFRKPGSPGFQLQNLTVRGRVHPIAEFEKYECGEMTQGGAEDPRAVGGIGEVKACVRLGGSGSSATDGPSVAEKLVWGSKGAAYLRETGGGFSGRANWQFTFADGRYVELNGVDFGGVAIFPDDGGGPPP